MAQLCLLGNSTGIQGFDIYVPPSCPPDYILRGETMHYTFIDSTVPQVVVPSPVPFDILTADPAVIGSAFSAGFFIFLAPLSVAWGARFIINFLKRI